LGLSESDDERRIICSWVKKSINNCWMKMHPNVVLI
jgi:hypothetical protein